MPIIVDRHRGQRVCRVVSNGSKQINILEDLVHALVGTTIKFEVKISDIILPSHDEEEQNEEEFHAEKPKERYTEKPREVPKEMPKAIPSEIPKDMPREVTREIPREVAGDMPREIRRDIPREIPREVARDIPREVAREIARNMPREIPRDIPREISRDIPREVARDIPKEIPREIARDMPREIPSEVAKDMLREIPKETFKEKPKESFQDIPKDNYEVIKPIKTSTTRSKLVRGSLTVGSIIKTCCISMDDSVKPPVAYISYDTSNLVAIANLLSNFSGEIEELRPMTTVNIGDIVYAKSSEDNMWYRSLVEEVEGEEVLIFFFDWGLREKLSKSRIRYITHPELGLSSYPACALKLTFTEETAATREFLKSESEFNLKVESYDSSTETYLVTVLN